MPVSKENLIHSELFSYLIKDREAEFAAEKAQLETRFTAEKAQLETRFAAEKAQLFAENAKLSAENSRLEEQLIQRMHLMDEFRGKALQKTLENAVIARFPQAPFTLNREIRKLTQPEQIQALIIAVIEAKDLAAFEQILHQTV